MPAGAIADQYGMSPRRDLGADLAQVGVHGLGIGVGHDHGGADGAVGADGSEDVGGDVPVVAHHARARADRRPDVGVAALLADAGFVLEPDLYRAGGGRRRERGPRSEERRGGKGGGSAGISGWWADT